EWAASFTQPPTRLIYGTARPLVPWVQAKCDEVEKSVNDRADSQKKHSALEPNGERFPRRKKREGSPRHGKQEEQKAVLTNEQGIYVKTIGSCAADEKLRGYVHKHHTKNDHTGLDGHQIRNQAVVGVDLHAKRLRLPGRPKNPDVLGKGVHGQPDVPAH